MQGYQKPGAPGVSPRKSGSPSTKDGDGLAMLRGDQRAHLGCVVRRVADLDVARGVDQQLGEAVVGGALHEDARPRAAVLAGVVEDGVWSCGCRLLEVGVCEDDVGGFAAELERDALDRSGGAFHHATADFGRAGEADLRDVGMFDEPLPDDAARSRRRR